MRCRVDSLMKEFNAAVGLDEGEDDYFDLDIE